MAVLLADPFGFDVCDFPLEKEWAKSETMMMQQVFPTLGSLLELEPHHVLTGIDTVHQSIPPWQALPEQCFPFQFPPSILHTHQAESRDQNPSAQKAFWLRVTTTCHHQAPINPITVLTLDLYFCPFMQITLIEKHPGIPSLYGNGLAHAANGSTMMKVHPSPLPCGTQYKTQ